MEESGDSVNNHYGRGGLKDRIQTAMEQVGIDLDQVSSNDLSPVDQFHTGGLVATKEMTQLAEVRDGLNVLDVGSGLGGVARHLAAEHGCTVTGVDLTAEFCDVARWLSELTGLSHLTTFHQGDATALPFEDGRFDQAWTMQVQMNIADKRKFYGEIYRVLKPGGRFVFQDILQGAAGEIHFPVPWAERPDLNFLISQPELQATLEQLGFQIKQLDDMSQRALEFRKRPSGQKPEEPSPLGIHLVMGESTKVKMSNQTANLEEGRVAYVRGILDRPT